MPVLSARALGGIPEVHAGDDLAELVFAAAGGELHAGDVLALVHTAVSKAEGATVALAGVRPGARARELARCQGKDPRMVQVVLDQSRDVMRAERILAAATAEQGIEDKSESVRPVSRTYCTPIVAERLGRTFQVSPA